MSLAQQQQATPSTEHGRMNKELFGVFGDAEEFYDHRSASEFHSVLEGETLTVGVRDPALGVDGRTSVAESDDGRCVVWGEAFVPESGVTPADWLLERYAAVGPGATSGLNGSYIAVVEHDGEAMVATDAIRTWECFYTDELGPRAFGTDATAFKDLVPTVTPRHRSVLEFLHLGTVLGDRSLFEELDRVPFDGYVGPDSVGEFDRFVYDPREGDHAADLADRLERAIERRADYPGRKGLLLSAGQDARTILAGPPEISDCYTVGSADSQEVKIAQRLADQYGSDHATLVPDVRYLRADDEKITYTQGIRESLHIHHAGYDDQLDVETIYHGLLYDTLFKGYFLERDSRDVFGTPVPSKRLAEDVDPVESLLDTLGFMPEGSRELGDRVDGLFEDVQVEDVQVEDPRAFLADSLREEFEAVDHRVDSVHNAMDLVVLRNQPVMAFRTHLADKYLESFVAADSELLQWHLETPPRHRHNETVDTAIATMDRSMLRHRPPDRPYRIELLNQIERFARRKLPLLTPVEPAWPDRDQIYDENHLDDHFFPHEQAVRGLPARQKLRVNDLRWWVS